MVTLKEFLSKIQWSHSFCLWQTYYIEKKKQKKTNDSSFDHDWDDLPSAVPTLQGTFEVYIIGAVAVLCF